MTKRNQNGMNEFLGAKCYFGSKCKVSSAVLSAKHQVLRAVFSAKRQVPSVILVPSAKCQAQSAESPVLWL